MDEGSDSEEGLLDSLDDNGVQDSGVGSSSEKAYRVIDYILYANVKNPFRSSENL